MSMSPRSFVSVLDTWSSPSFARRMHPAQVPRIGIPSCARRAMSSKSPNFTRSFEIVVLSPPGIVRASTFARSGGRRTVTASPASPASLIARCIASTCSLTSPWTPTTPTRTPSRRREVPIRVRGSRRGPAVPFPEEGLEDLRELLGVLREPLRRDPVDQDPVPGLDVGERMPHDVVSLREDSLAAGRTRERVRPSLVQGNDLERVVEEEGPHVSAAQQADADPIDLGIELRVRQQRVALDSDLVEGEISRIAAERSHVPVPQGLEGKRRGHDGDRLAYEGTGYLRTDASESVVRIVADSNDLTVRPAAPPWPCPVP